MHHGRRFIHYDSLDGRTLRARRTYSLFYDAYYADICSTDYSSEIGNGEVVEIAHYNFKTTVITYVRSAVKETHVYC